LIYGVALDVHYSHELANRELWVKELHRASVLVFPSLLVLGADVANFFSYYPLKHLHNDQNIRAGQVRDQNAHLRQLHIPNWCFFYLKNHTYLDHECVDAAKTVSLR
jgi:hypothetical protein